MKKIWLLFATIIGLSFATLLWIGTRIYQEKPPIPAVVQTTDGKTITTGDEIMLGQNVWQSIGGMEVGSIWGHGSYVAPDWTADWLHREAVFVLEKWAQTEHAASYDKLNDEQQAVLLARLRKIFRTNTYVPPDPTSAYIPEADPTRKVTLDPVRAEAFESNVQYISDVFKNGRDSYAIPAGALTDDDHLRALASFFFWTSWAASTERPGQDITYTHNWPHEPLIGNRATGETIVWTGVSVIMLLAGIGALLWWYVGRAHPRPEGVPESDPLLGAQATPSQKASLKYFYVAALLILVQILVGVITAHYAVEGGGFYGFPLAKWLPYSVARTWHIQLGIFWIATSWLGAGLYIGPLVSGKEPPYQRFLVNVLFGALLVIVVGSLAGQWLSVMRKMSLEASFLWGHQGYEYVDLGRVWQAALMAGLLIWFFLVVRSILPALRQGGEQRQLLLIFLMASAAIALFYGAGFAWGRHTHLSVAEYWRWWVIHLWVEGFFEVFATVVIAFFFTRLKLVNAKLAAEASLITALIYLTGGVIGTCHHLYFSGTPTVALAFGSVFSALEVVPLLLISFAAMEDWNLSQSTYWVRNYRWPIYFFIAVAFWNLLGAGIFGFMINPPIALYFMQGLNTTPVHGHAALFGVYGILGMGLMLFCLKATLPGQLWKTKLLAFSFWAINIGLFAMVVISVLPVGLLQTWAAVEHGYWYARSAEFMQKPVINVLRWLRVPGDTIFALGAVGFVIFILGARTRLFAAPEDGRDKK